MKRIFKSTVLMSSTTLIVMFLNIVKTKVMAILIGSSGMGVFSLYIGFYQILSSLGGILSGGGLVKFISENNQDFNLLIETKKYIIYLLILYSVLISLLILLFSSSISNYLFNSSIYKNEIIILGFFSIVINFSIFYQSWLNGFRRVTEIAKVRLYTSIFVVLISILLLYILGIKSLIYLVLLAPLFSLIFSYIYSKRIKLYTKKLNNIFYKKEIINLVKIGLALVIISIVFQLGILTSRAIITNILGVKELGLIFASWTISMSYIEIFLSALVVDFFPKLSSLKEDREGTNKFVNEQIYFLMLLLVPIIFMLFIFSDYIIILLYNQDFLPSTNILKIQLIGDIFKIVTWILGYLLIVHDLLKYSFIFQLIWIGGYLLLLQVGLSYLGIEMAGIAFLISYFIGSILVYFLLKKKNIFYFTKNNLKIFVFIFFTGLFLTLIELYIVNYKLLVEFIVGIIFMLITYAHLFKLIEGKKWIKSKTQK